MATESETVLFKKEIDGLLAEETGTEAVSVLRVVTSCSSGVCEMADEGEVSSCTTASLDDCDGEGTVGVTSSAEKFVEGEETL